MKKRFYIGDKERPWWIDRLLDIGFIVSIEPSSITDILTYKRTKLDSKKNYLYDGDFLEYDTDTGSVTIGHKEWDSILEIDTLEKNFKKFQEGLRHE